MWLGMYYSALFFKSGKILQLDPTYDAMKIDLDKYSVDPRIDAGWQGKIYGADLQISTNRVVWANLDLADEVGVDLPTWGTPEWDTWVWDTDFVPWVKAGMKETSAGDVEQWGVEGVHASLWATTLKMIVENDGAVFEWDDWWDFEEKECLINSPECVGGLQRWMDLVTTHKVAPSPLAIEAGEITPFKAGKSMALLSQPGMHVMRDVGFPMALFSMPYTNFRSQEIGADYIAVSADSKVSDVAAEFAVFLSTDELVLTNMCIEAMPPNFDTRKHVEKLSGWPREAQEVWASRHAKGCGVPDICKTVTTFPAWLGDQGIFVRDRVGTAMQSAYAGEMTLQQALDEAKAEIDALLQG
jgi:ABC-type glycerol-3-phosphate transport system substrate-binding protein